MGEKAVYIMLTDTGTLFTKAIKWYTRKPYNHASIALDPKLSELYSFGRKKIENPFIGGFVKEDIRTALFKEAECAIYLVRVTDEQLVRLTDFIQDMEGSKDNYRYNLVGLLGVVLNRPIPRKNVFFCSQFVATVLKDCGVIDFGKPVSLVRPNDLADLPEFKLVYRGKLKEYCYDSLNEHHLTQQTTIIPLEIGGNILFK